MNFNKHQQLSLFRKGLSWGIIVSLTTIISGTIGVSLILISPVNQVIMSVMGQTKTFNLSSKQSVTNLAPNYLYKPVNILFIGIEPVKTTSNNYSHQKRDGNHNLAEIVSGKNNYQLKNLPIAVQNTTDNPELASRLLDFLKQRDFRNVYLIDHLPIDLNQTEIIVERGNIVLADYLKKNLSLGRLELSPTSDANFELTIRIGEDAQYLNVEDDFIRY